jgi:hypothetical protein
MIRQGDVFGSWSVVGRYGETAAFICRHKDSGSRGLLYVADPSSGLPMAAVQRKAQLLGRLDHPVALGLLEVCPQEGWLVTQLASGDILKAKLEGSVVELTDALRMARQVADCLSKAHAAGVYHLQVRPEQVVFWREQVKLLHFSDDQQLPPVSETPPAWHFPYLPPELHKVGSADPVQWDCYALGITLYEALTGNRAHVPADQQGDVPTWMVRDKIRTAHLDPGPAFPQPVRRLVQQATASRPRRRFASAAVFRDAVAHTEEQLANAQTGMSSALRTALRIVLAVLLLMVVGGVAVMLAGMDAERLVGQPARTVRLVVNSDEPDALTRVTLNDAEPAQVVGNAFYFTHVPLGPADVHVISGKGCGPPYCPGEKCPFCCTGARVTRTIEPGAGEQNLIIPVEAGAEQEPRPVLITTPDLPAGARTTTRLYGDAQDPDARRDAATGGWRFPAVVPGSYELWVEVGSCPRAAVGCYPEGRCPKGCTSLVDVLLVPCGDGDLEIAVDVPAPL